MKAITLLVVILLSMAAAAFGQQQAEGTAHVTVIIEPAISVAVLSEPVQVANPFIGDIYAMAQYWIGSNGPSVNLSCRVTALQHPNGHLISPTDQANVQTALSGPEYALLDIPGDYMGIPSMQSAWDVYIADADTFATEVDVTGHWTPNPNAPTGEWTAWITLFAIVDP